MTFFAGKWIWLCRIAFKHCLAIGFVRRRKFGFSGVGRVVFAVPETRVGDVLSQPWLAGPHYTRQHVSHQSGFACDDFEVFVDVAHFGMKAAGGQVS